MPASVMARLAFQHMDLATERACPCTSNRVLASITPRMAQLSSVIRRIWPEGECRAGEILIRPGQLRITMRAVCTLSVCRVWPRIWRVQRQLRSTSFACRMSRVG